MMMMMEEASLVALAVKRNSGQHHGDLRNALESAALLLVAERGPRGFSLAEVTRRAGVSVSAPYKHFPDRDALLASLAEQGYDEQHRRFAAAVASETRPVEQLVAFAGAYVCFAAEERALFEITYRSGLDKALYPALAVAGSRVLEALTAPADSLTGDSSQALELIYAVAAAAHGFAMFLVEGVFSDDHDALTNTIVRAQASARIIAENAVSTTAGR